MHHNKTFYPTPDDLIERMLSKVKGHPAKILEPSAGKGDIVETLGRFYGDYRSVDISAIEIDEDLQATLIGKGIKVIDTDFLAYAGPDKWDLIIANPPFLEGDKHLMKAMDIMYNGEIVFLLNAETLKNPHTNLRMDLVKRLTKLNAEIEYLDLAFRDAERSTDVECALIYINIEREIEDDLFECCTDGEQTIKGPDEKDREYEISTGKTIEELVAEYNQTIRIGTETIMAYFKNYPKIWKYIGLNTEPKNHSVEDKTLTKKVQNHLNELLRTVRTDYWRRTLDLKEVRSRLTQKKQAEFEEGLKQRCHMDFTESNIRQFVLNLMGGFEQNLIDAVLEIFDLFTIKHSYGERGEFEENVHYYNGWKTNRAFFVNKKVIIPLGYQSFFDKMFNQWKVNYTVKDKLRDIDVVANYFDGMPNYTTITEAIENAFRGDYINGRFTQSSNVQTKGIKSTYFTVNVFKKDTIHIIFNSDDILRRFNIAACRGKGWLPGSYGTKPYQDMEPEEKAVVDSFEGQLSYTKHLNQPLFAPGNRLAIAA